ncbi:hypothetical protein [Agilicoccus flavus]|uniref:hypothetical protein n=1 Tax=Agilicoccus flavus TaxID=2775968 RepID=UPI001CF63EC8|nr:hypothetical protein [Agilicoccus flavus]
MTDHDTDRFVRTYVQHHWVASKGGLDAFRRCARTLSVPQGRPVLARLAAEVAQDRASLRSMMRRLGVGTAPAWQAAASVGETLGRLKPNGTLIRRSPLTDVIEIEMLATAVEAKKSGWLTLRRLAETDTRLDAAELDRLVERADAQRAELEALRPAAVDCLAG